MVFGTTKTLKRQDSVPSFARGSWVWPSPYSTTFLRSRTPTQTPNSLNMVVLDRTNAGPTSAQLQVLPWTHLFPTPVRLPEYVARLTSPSWLRTSVRLSSCGSRWCFSCHLSRLLRCYSVASAWLSRAANALAVSFIGSLTVSTSSSWSWVQCTGGPRLARSAQVTKSWKLRSTTWTMWRPQLSGNSGIVLAWWCSTSWSCSGSLLPACAAAHAFLLL